MALTMEKLQSLVRAVGLKFFVDPDRDALMLSVNGANGRYQLFILLEVDGEFLQFRTLQYHSCPSDHPHADATLRLLGELNCRLRYVKFGWDPSDGEIVAYGDTWISDGDVTAGQMNRLTQSFLSVIDVQYARIDATIKTGKDPGETDPFQGGSGLPPEVQKVLDRIRKGREGEGNGSDDDDDDDAPPRIDEL